MKHETVTGPLAKFIESHRPGVYPVPLVSTSYSVEVRSGLAAVRLSRTFRNVEKRPIEATVTFPVPFDAAVNGIEAKVNGRILSGRAQAKAVARQSYEDAIDSCKPAVLHEELLRGIHMLSVANVAPGAEIEVTATFAVPLALADGTGRLRIPVTLGQVYGQVPLVESDAPETGGPVMEAEVTVASASGTVFVNGGAADGGKVSVMLDRPIEIKVVGLYTDTPGAVWGRAADGRAVSIGFTPAAARDQALDIDVLLDVSGSMRERIESNPEGDATKWDAVVSGMKAASGRVLAKADRATLWTFSNDCRRHGETSGDELDGFMDKVPFSNGGTEIPGAVAAVTASRSEANVLLVTDGKSWNRIAVQDAVATGARFTVVLVGEDSLESSVGYLAAMTGGQMFVVSGSDVHRALSAALSSMRDVASPAVRIQGTPEKLSRTIAGTTVEVAWSKAKKGSPKREGFALAAAGFAAHLAIQGMDEEEAARFAEAEGIVSHLTSIVLVDEAAEAVQGIPATRKVALATPATASLTANAVLAAASPVMRSMAYAAAPAVHGMDESLQMLSGGYPAEMWNEGTARNGTKGGLFFGTLFPHEAAPDAGRGDQEAPWPAVTPSSPFNASLLVGVVTWDSAPEALAAGNLTGLPEWVSYGIIALSNIDEVKELARATGLTDLAAAVALLAQADGKTSRTAARIARKAFSSADATLVGKARKAAGF